MIEAYRYRWAAPFLDRYNHRLLKTSFARVRVAGLDNFRNAGALLAVGNHSCWWDGAVDLYLSRTILGRRTYLMMGETELSKHRVFSSLGVFSVPDRQGEASRMTTSVRYALRQMQDERELSPILWIYAQGEMLPARAPIRVRDGSLMISERAGVPVVTVAHRYEFLRDDHPEVILRVGETIGPLRRDEASRDQLRDALRALLDRVDRDVAANQLDDYAVVLRGVVSRNERLQNLRRGGSA